MSSATSRGLSVVVLILNLGYLHGTAGRVDQHGETTLRQRGLLMGLDIPEPPRFFAIEPTKPAQ